MKESYLLAFELAKTSKPFSEGEFLVSWEQEQIKKKISLSHRTVTCSVEFIEEDLASKVNKKAQSFTLYSLV